MQDQGDMPATGLDEQLHRLRGGLCVEPRHARVQGRVALAVDQHDGRGPFGVREKMTAGLLAGGIQEDTGRLPFAEAVYGRALGLRVKPRKREG